MFDIRPSLTDTTQKPIPLGTITTSKRFSSLHWVKYTSNDEFPLGLLVGGMEDGLIQVWDAQQFVGRENGTIQETALLGSVPLHDRAGPVTALNTSPLDTHMLCAGASNGQVAIVDLTNPRQKLEVVTPGPHSKTAAVTSVAWNSQVAHIVATAAGDGTISVWDLNARKLWCEIRAEQVAVSDVLWNPSQGLHLLTASADDRAPLIKVWDLRNSTSMPLATMPGHTAGLLKMAWCPHDESLLLSTAKDNRTILWDLYTLQQIGDLPNEDTKHQVADNPGALFAASSVSEKLRFDLQWSPLMRGMLLTCSNNRQVQFHSIMALAAKSSRPPAWMKPASSVRTGFGGAIISCGTTHNYVTITTVSEEPELVTEAVRVETELANTTDIDFCRSRTGHPWGFLRVVFESNARQQLLEHLRFSTEDIAEQVAKLALSQSDSSLKKTLPTPPPPPAQAASSMSGKRTMTEEAEELVKKALLVGNFEAAVDVSFEAGNFGDALLLASCGGAELWSQTQDRYLEQESNRRPYLAIARAILTNRLDTYVEESDLAQWRETLAILATYGQSEQFPQLCMALGERLEAIGQDESASNCYMCALHLEGAVRFWMKQLELERKSDNLALLQFVVKVSILHRAVGENTPLPEPVSLLFHEHATILANQGLYTTAAKYSQTTTEAGKILQDRLYRSRASPRCLMVMGNVAPEFPFPLVAITKSAGQFVVGQNYQDSAQQSQQTGHQHVPYSQQQQQYTYSQQDQLQSQYQQQQQQYGQQYEQFQTSTTSFSQQQDSASVPSDQLPAGWVALRDPSSGQTYYANEMTGETTWDRPSSADVRQAQVMSDASYHSRASNGGTPTVHLVSKYGDGFVTSASHPEVASKYGNVGTVNPYQGVERPGTAAAAAGVTPSKAPVSGSLNFDNVELTQDHHQVKDTLLGLVEAIKGCNLNPIENRQVLESEKALRY